MLYVVRLIAVMSLWAGLSASFGAASAQSDVKGLGGKPKQEDAAQAASRRKDAKEREDAYTNAMKNIPEQKANKDPWAGAR